MNRLLRYLIPLGLAALLVTFAAPAAAQKVANPGTFNFKVTSGVMKVKTQEFGFDESQNINFNGTVDKNGNVSIPSITFPNYALSASGFNLTIKINVVGPTTGTINPLNGAVSLRLRVWIKIDGVPLGGDCRIASSSSPIDVNTLITGTSGGKTGTPYNPSNGTMRVVNTTFGVPESSSCGPAGGTVNSTVGLPSPAGNNSAELNLKTTGNINRAITPALTATPASGTAPFQTTLSAAGSSVTAGPATYRWDFTNDGSIDATTSTPTTTHTYTAGGTPSARVQVVDKDGDVADATRSLTVNAFPDLGITAAHDGDFRVGNVETYRIGLKNHGYAATSGPVTVSSTLPAGLTYDSVTGSGWSCSATGQDLSCSRSAAIAVDGTAPELGVKVKVGPAAFDAVTPTFTVAATGDNGAGNNTASDSTAVRATDLEVHVSHDAHAMLLGPDPANLITLAAENVGDASTVGPTVITDELPAGLTPLSATGTGWTCTIAGQLVTCTYDAVIAPGATTEAVTVAVDAALDQGSLGSTVDNSATVTTADDLVADNNTATDPTLILNGQDIGITKSHQGDFTAGAQESYTLTAKNFGTQSTTGPTTITDVLPGTLNFASVDGGTDWQCEQETGTVTCVHDEPIAAGASAPEVTLTTGVSVEAIPLVSNTATVETTGDPNPANDSSTDQALVQAIDLKVTKTHDSVLRVGHQASYTLKVQNAGDSTSTGPTTLTDELPAGLGFVSADGGADWVCDETGGTVTCTHDGLLGPEVAASDVVLTVDVGLAAAPEVANGASVATQDDFNQSNNSAIDPGTVVEMDTGIEIGRTGTFKVGHTGTYLIGVENFGAVSTSGPTLVTVSLPAGLEFVSGTGNGWACEAVEQTVTCTRTAALAAETAAPELALAVDISTGAVPSVSTTATVATANDRFSGNDTASDEAGISAPDLEVTSDHEGPFRVGGTHTYDLTVRNVGNGPTVGEITLTDELPDGFAINAAYGTGWSCTTAGSTLTCSRSTPLAAGEFAPAITVEVKPTPATLAAGENSATVENEVTVTTATDTNPVNDVAVDPTDLVATDLALSMGGPAAVNVGAIAEYTLTVVNDGSAGTGAPVRITNTVPAGFSPRGGEGDDWTCSSAGRKLTCVYGQPVEAGAAVPELTLRARAGESATGTAVNNAVVSTDGDVVAENDTAAATSEVSAAPDLEVGLRARTQAGDRFRVGSDGGYEVTVRNRGSAATTASTRVQIDLPKGFTFLGLDGGQGWNCPAVSAATVNCEYSGSIDAGAISTFGFLTEIVPATADTVSATATVTDDDDANPENDTAVELTNVVRIDLALSRAAEPAWTAGASGTYGLRVTNAGTAATAGPAVITEILPLGTTFATATGEDWTCAVSGRRLRCVNPASLAPGDLSELRVTLNLGQAVTDRINATSTVTTVGDADSANDVATEQIAVDDGTVAGVRRPIVIRTKRTTATKSGIVTVWLGCDSASTSKCRGVLRLKSVGKVKLNQRKRARLALGKARFAVAPGKQAPVRITLKGTVRKALVLNRKIRTKAVATNDGLSSSSKSIVVRAAK